MKPVLLSLFIAVTLSAAQQKQTFTGVITDEMCPLGTHSHMKMGPTDAECAKACAMSHDAKYMLYDGKSAYFLSDQTTPEKFAAQRVRVMGTLDATTMTIHVDSIAAASSRSRSTRGK
jgi:hypothetical protein